MCRSMADIQSVAAKIRRGKKRKKPQGKNIMSASATQGGHEHTTNLGTGVSRLPVLDCGMTFHPGFGGRDSPSILSDDL